VLHLPQVKRGEDLDRGEGTAGVATCARMDHLDDVAACAFDSGGELVVGVWLEKAQLRVPEENYAGLWICCDLIIESAVASSKRANRGEIWLERLPV